MKKLSLILAFVLVFACTVLAACNDETDTSSTADSSAVVESSVAESAADTSSEAEASSEADVSSEAESSEAESSEVVEDSSEAESSEVVDESSEPEISNAPVGDGANLVAGKTYTVTGCGTGYINESGQWPSKYDGNLTDGVANDELVFGLDNKWFGFYNNDSAAANLVNAPGGVGSVTFDLGKKTDISGVRVHLGNHHGNGVPSPKAVTVYISDNGSDFTEYGTLETKNSEDAANAVLAYWSEVGGSASAKFVKIEFQLNGVFAFLDEVEVIGA
ncbi:MAG: discoidin domain-containing protein [Clostridia bacterium]|nr:discoidin domain-containing protein [Clostridia bacterium]